MATYTPADDYQSRVAVELGRFRTWAGSSYELWVGELGYPNDKGADQSDFNAMFDFLLAKAGADNLHITYWATGHKWGSYALLPYEPVTTSPLYDPDDGWTTTNSTTTYEGAYGRTGLFTGVNYAGLEFAHTDTIENPSSTHEDSGIEAAGATYIGNRGADLIRIPVRWERMASSIGGALDSTWVTILDNAMDDCAAAGLDVIIDIHNYGLIHTNSGDKYLSDSTTRAGWIDLLERILDEFGSHSAFYALDIMNEPVYAEGTGGDAGDWSAWETYSQAAVSTLRTDGYNHKLAIETGNWAGVQDLSYIHTSGPWITDSADNFLYSAHYYPCNNHYDVFGTYSAEVSAASSFSGQGEFEWDGTTNGDYGGEAPSYDLGAIELAFNF